MNLTIRSSGKKKQNAFSSHDIPLISPFSGYCVYHVHLCIDKIVVWAARKKNELLQVYYKHIEESRLNKSLL